MDTPAPALLSVHDVLNMLGRKSRSTLTAIIERDPTFPRPVQIPGGRPQWRRTELEEYVNGLPRS